jgi:hypothetical protein
MRWVVAAGLLVGTLVALAVAVFDDDRGPATPGLLEAYERSRTATYVITEVFERRLVDGRTFSTESVTAQRPPDRLVVDGGTVSGVINGERVACAVGSGDNRPCRRAPASKTYEQEVREEVDLLRALVTGPFAAYEVHHGEAGCYELRLRARILNPPYGEDAELCFDEKTGAPKSSLIHRTQSTDTREATEVRSTVREQDLDPSTFLGEAD